MAIIGELKLSVQLLSGGEPAIGPGKAMVLEAVARTGSISAAGRDLGMSYRRTWLLVDSLNRCWSAPLVDTAPGGRGGSRLTALGEEVLHRYRLVEAEMAAIAASPNYQTLRTHLLDRPRPAAAEMRANISDGD